MKKLTSYVLAGGLCLASLSSTGQDTLRNKKNGGYLFTMQKSYEPTSIQDQCKTGTCWSFSALSFFESELMRKGKGKHNLSEMFVVRNAYVEKARNFVRMHSLMNFGPGGAFHDVPFILRRYGIVPEEVYRGLNYGEDKHNHNQMDNMLKAMLKSVVNEETSKISNSWEPAFTAALDSYLGAIPKEFTYQGKTYTPQSFSASLGLNMDDYVSLTSFSHHPFYESFVLEVPDNWQFQSCYNVPLDVMMQIVDNALNNGMTVAWAGDVSEKGFNFRQGLAIVPKDESAISKNGQDNKQFNDAGAAKAGSPFDAPCEEKEVTQDVRQKAFDTFETTDDHGMHIVGIAKDQTGKKFYKVKNSWGAVNDLQGFFFASDTYVKYKTTNILVHKDAIPKEILRRLGK